MQVRGEQHRQQCDKKRGGVGVFSSPGVLVVDSIAACYGFSAVHSGSSQDHTRGAFSRTQRCETLRSI